MAVICLYAHPYQHVILKHLNIDLSRYICRFGCYLQIKYLSADIGIFADMQIWENLAHIYRQVFWQILSADWTIGRTLTKGLAFLLPFGDTDY